MPDRLEVESSPMGVGRRSRAVAGVAEAAVEAQRLQYGNANLAKDLLDGVSAGYAGNTTALSRKVGRGERRVGVENLLFPAPLEAERDRYALLGAGEPDAVGAKIRGHRATQHTQQCASPEESRSLKVGERFGRDSADGPDVVRNAIWVAAVEYRATGRPGRDRIGDHIHGTDDSGYGEIVEVGLLKDHLAGLE